MNSTNLYDSAGRVVSVETGARLHFGMLSFGQADVRQFGGVGAMIGSPGFRIRITLAAELHASGPFADRAVAVARRVLETFEMPAPCAVRIEIMQAPPPHLGYGSGTQLGLAIAKGVRHIFNQPEVSITTLAAMSGRGLRSAVGAYGFEQGGMLVTAGKRGGKDSSRGELGPLLARAELPHDWRFVLIASHVGEGLSGAAEQQAFDRLPAVNPQTSAALSNEVLLHLLPSAIEGHFSDFSSSLYRYGHIAGTCFAAGQGGPFASAEVAHLIASLRAEGIEGVGQSSWGPLVFAVVESQAAAEQLSSKLRHRLGADQHHIEIAAPLNHGATVSIQAG